MSYIVKPEILKWKAFTDIWLIVQKTKRFQHILPGPPEPFPFIFQCHIWGSVRILCRFQKCFIITCPPPFSAPPALLCCQCGCFIFPTVNQPSNGTNVQGLNSDLRILMIWFYGCITWDMGSSFSLVWVWCLSSVWRRSSGIEEILATEEMNTSRVWCAIEKTRIMLLILYMLSFSTCWLFWFMMECDGCFNKDILALSCYFVWLHQSWYDWTSQSLVKV